MVENARSTLAHVAYLFRICFAPLGRLYKQCSVIVILDIIDFIYGYFRSFAKDYFNYYPAVCTEKQE